MGTELDRQARQRKFRFAARRASTHLPRHLPSFFFLTDPARTPDPLGVAGALPKGSGIILRHFGREGQIRQAGLLARIARRRRLVLLIAADPRLARDVGADGVHWPEACLPDARLWRGRFPLMTASAHSRAALARAASAGVDAAVVSTVFPSASPTSGPAMGAVRLRKLCRQTGLAVYALGGVTHENALKIANTAGFAAVSSLSDAFGAANDPKT
jgi:thiamine-phosphate pyrophosphorylase